MNQGTEVWHRFYGIAGVIVRADNGVTAFVRWSNGVGTEVSLTSVKLL